MIALSALSVLALAGVVAAQNVIPIQVGGAISDPFIFTPNNVTASEGDVIMFTFSGAPGNHSVTQSTFSDPCNPSGDGFDSGNILIPMGTTTGFPTWNLTITNTSEPIWFFCKQLIPQTHCNTFAAFVAAAEQLQGPAGQSVGFLVGQGASASAVPGPLSGSISGFGLPNPSATAPLPSAISAASTSAAASTPSSAALVTKANGFVVVLAAMFGVALA
ncbi:hypothetical protein EW145_g4509 [Phellinidium pouzarii]|uniref:Blue (type 1) copper domain-containing protein n=1 Tax=Phellinidium pouzarii TaxID=167371 RepID=A0A4S4L3E6_9AGAM|nr:hypothetical protein EW145_g4509 [Phellinidium pouzarii]